MDKRTLLFRHFKNAESFTKDDAVQIIGKYYYCNQRFHVGNILSRLVKGGALKRLKQGRYKFTIILNN
jgi:predicted transcriptional regulator of viral defense system